EYDAEWALGFLYSSLAVGSLIATATSGWVGRVHHHGRIIMLAALAWGLAIMAAGLVHEVWGVRVFLVVAGMADMVSGLFRSLIWDSTIPDVIRGRMAGLELLSYSVGPQVGQVRSTLTARYTSAQASLVIGGSVCAASIAGMVPALRELWSFDARTAVQGKAAIVTR
ncbi:MAG: MFS transporter, partial [Ilumatobacteraceae bacterium]